MTVLNNPSRGGNGGGTPVDLPVDAAANVASLRTLGRGVGQAAVGARNYCEVVLYDTSAGQYAPRPEGLPNGLAIFVGPTQPTGWLSLDAWDQTT